MKIMNNRIILTREHEISNDQKILLQQNNIEYVHIPLIKCVPVILGKDISMSINHAEWVFFTSAVSVDFFMPYLKYKQIKFGVIGEQTEKALKKYVNHIHFLSSSAYGKDFIMEFHQKYPKVEGKILFPQSSLSNPQFVSFLKEKHYDVHNFIMYETKSCALEQQNKIEQIMTTSHQYNHTIWTFASPSAFINFYEVVKQLPNSHQIAVIGNTTRKCIEDMNFSVNIQPDKPSINLLIEKIVNVLNS